MTHIGRPQRTIYIEPVQDPLPGRKAPVKEPAPSLPQAPEKDKEREKVPA